MGETEAVVSRHALQAEEWRRLPVPVVAYQLVVGGGRQQSALGVVDNIRVLETCDRCGLTYAELRTGYTFAEVRVMMKSASPDPKDWRQKRRNSVLGFWRELKLQLWYYHVGLCNGV